MSDAYAGQDRGSTSDYDRYLRGMDASMRQKVALTAAHLLAEGRVADMGMGSGAGSHALAALYPELEVARRRRRPRRRAPRARLDRGPLRPVRR